MLKGFKNFLMRGYFERVAMENELSAGDSEHGQR